MDFTRYAFDLGWREIHPHPYGEFVSAFQTAQALRLAAQMLADADRFVEANEIMRLVAQLERYSDE